MEPDFSQFVRKPFLIEAVQITEENMEPLCELIGHEIRPKGNTRFIVVDKRIVPNGYRAYVGWWVTKMGDNLRCYPNRVFNDQFIPYGPEWESWFEDEAEPADVSTQVEDEAEADRQTIVVFDAEADRETESNIITVTGPSEEEVVTDEEARENDEVPLEENAIAQQDALDHVMKDDDALDEHRDEEYSEASGETIEREL